MSKLITFILFTSVAVGSFSQTLKRTYYDEYTKTILLEEYYVNSAGYGNGLYKKYWKDGNLTLKGTYKDGSKEGVWTSYSNISGKQEVSQTETYKNNQLNGPAVYYMEGTLVKEKGNYLNDERDGEWEILQSFDSYGFPEEIRKGAKYVKGTFHYKEGKIVYPDGERKVYFYPSGKIYVHGNYLDGKMVGDQIMYNPDGTIKTQQHFDTAEELELKKQEELVKKQKEDEDRKIRLAKIYKADSLLFAGQFDESIVIYKEVNVGTSELEKLEVLLNEYDPKNNTFVSFEKQFNDLNKSLFMSEKQIEYCQIKFKDIKSNYTSRLNRANRMILAGYYDEALLAYTDLGFKTDLLTTFNLKHQEYIKRVIILSELINHYNSLTRISYNYPKEQMDYCENVIKKEQGTIDDVGVFEPKIEKYRDTFDSLFIVKKQTILVDGTGKSIMQNTYPRGKDFYLKSKIVFDLLLKESVLAETESKKETRELNIQNAIQTLSKIPESEWKDLNKQLKKIDDPEQIKAILKI